MDFPLNFESAVNLTSVNNLSDGGLRKSERVLCICSTLYSVLLKELITIGHLKTQKVLKGVSVRDMVFG